ncbi:MAG TPA: hypothetical protein VMU67_03715 [Steroidobacteraceae bacterium]|nr:hypothetical protein [Steroidobacteraceae bacterium]
MDLKDFVIETLTQIAEGVAKASENVAAVGGIVNPEMFGDVKGMRYEGHGEILYVEFTVALSVNEGTATKGGIGVVTGFLAAGSQGQSSEARASTTHITFKVPIVLPASKKS